MNNQPKPGTSENTNKEAELAGYSSEKNAQTDIRANRVALGAALRDARLSSGMSEDAVAQVTRITRSYIVALESGDFDKLPGAVFGRGFVRSICRLLGLDQEEFSRRYASCWAADEMRNTLKAPAAEGAISQRMPARKKLNFDLSLLLKRAPLPTIKFDGQLQMALLIAAPVLAVLAAITVVAVRQSGVQQKQASAEQVAAPAAVPAEAPVEVASQPAAAQPQAQTPVQEEPPMELNNAKASFEQVLELIVIEPVKIKLVEDKKAPSVKQLKPDAYRFTFSDRAELTVYDASAVEVAYNGRSLGSLGAKGRIRKLIFQTGAPKEMPAAAQATDQVGETAKKL